MSPVRLFVAAWPDDATRSVLTSLPPPDPESFRVVPPENWHVTLRFLGDVDVEATVAALAGTALPSATAVLGPVVEVLDGHLVVPVSGVDGLAAAVVDATRHLGSVPDRPFRGHLTIARRRARGPGRFVPGGRLDAGFEIASVALVHSDLTPTGPRYRTIADLPVGTPAPP